MKSHSDLTEVEDEDMTEDANTNGLIQPPDVRLEKTNIETHSRDQVEKQQNKANKQKSS